jgi:hypothetical protein
MDEASLFEVFWAESGYVIGRLLDSVLQWDDAPPGWMIGNAQTMRLMSA